MRHFSTKETRFAESTYEVGKIKYIQYTKLPEESSTVGDLAINEHGALGVVTGYDKSSKTYSGVHVSNDFAPKGSLWLSEEPNVVGCVDNAMAFVESLKDE